jgi:uncharacterized membrane protein
MTPRALTFIVYADGYVSVEYHLDVNKTYPIINVTLFGETFNNLLVVDEHQLPLEFFQDNDTVSISTLGSEQLLITYFTSSLTSKTGLVWSFTVEIPVNATITLPYHASIVDLSDIPYLIEGQDGEVTLVMPEGFVEISYILEKQQTEFPIFVWSISIPIVAGISVLIYWWVKQKKTGEKPPRVNIEKILHDHQDLRPEEQKALQFLIDNHGKAYEAELYETLNLPRTSTWRLIKRLERMEIVEITKSRRQNVVHINPKYRE